MFLVPFLRGLARHTLLGCLALTAATATVFAQTNTPSAADGFDPNVDGNVFAIATQPADGKLVVVGQFANLQPNGGIGFPRNNIARINPDGTLDTDFNPNVNGAVRAVVIQKSDGKIIIGGDFTTVGGVARTALARLNKDGSLDTTFNPVIGGVPVDTNVSLKPQVLALALQSDERILVGGSFGSIKGTSATAAVTRNNIARLDSNGGGDAFNPNANGPVLAIALHLAGKIVIGGSFTELQSPEKTTRLHAARLNPDGTVDSQFDPKPDNGVTTIKVQSDGKIVLGGYFNTVQPLKSDGTVEAASTRSHIARLNADAYGSVDSEFYPVIGGNVLAIELSPDGGILVGGNFSQVWGRGNVSATRPFVARFAVDGTLDETFNPGVNGDVDAFGFQADGKIVIGGYFTRAQPAGLSSAIVRNRLARVLPNGALDTAFQIDSGGRVLASVVQTSDNKIVVAGSFTSIGGLTRHYIARLNTDGTVDASYDPNLNGPVYALAYDAASNKIIAGGGFTTVGGENRNHIVRLNPTGTLDSEFNPNIDGAVGSIVIQKDGAILVGGAFSTAQPIGATLTARANILRLTPAGQLDATFNPTTNSAVAAIALQDDGKILIVGSFNAIQPGATGTITGRSGIARLNADGTLDTSYNPNANAPIMAIALQKDGKAVIGGRFNAFLPNNTTTVVLRSFIARVNVDGTIDADFDPHANNMVLAVAVQPDQKIVLAGAFTTLQPAGDADWTLRKYVARVTTAGKVDPTFNLDLNELAGNRVDSLNALGNEDLLLGGTFESLQPTGTSPRIVRSRFARVTSGAVAAFNPAAAGAGGANVKAIAIQPDGKIVVGGDFADLGGATSKNLARYNPEGTQDATFNSALSTNGVVNALAIRGTTATSNATQLGGFAWFENNGTLRASFKPTLKVQGQITAAIVQSTGKIIIAGAFSDFSNRTSGNLLRFNADGTVDESFQPTKVNGAVISMKQDSNGKILIAGSFTSINDVSRNHVARLDGVTGALEAFDPNANGIVNALAVQTDGLIVLGGTFSALQPTINGTAQVSTTRNYVARVKADGSVDLTYDPNLNGSVNALAIQPNDNKVVVGGNFTTAQPNGAAATTTRNFVARFNADGSLDQNFNPNPNGAIAAIVVQPSDGKIILGGVFTTLQPTINATLQPVTTRNHVARVGSDGAVDASFNPNVNGIVSSLALSADGTSLLLGGAFSTLQPGTATATVARSSLARVDNNGLLDTTFNPDIAGTVTSVSYGPDGSVLVGGSFTSLQPNGVILVGGSFTDIGGISGSNKNLAQLNGDGSINATFQPNPNGAVNALLPLADGRFLVGGDFTTIASTSRDGIARFTTAGVLDTSFAPAATGGVTAVAAQSDGKVIVATRSAGLRRLDTNGATDTSFAPTISFAGANGLAVQPDGKIVVAGPDGLSDRVIRFNADGSVDSSFTSLNSAPAGSIKAIALQADGSIIIAGSFKNLGGSYNGLARLKANGALDSTFNPNVNDTVTALALQSDGRLMFGGSFTTVGGLARVGLARIGNTAPAPQTIGVSADGRTVTLIRRSNTSTATTSTAGELSGVTFEWSSDLLSWTTLGAGTRIATSSDWQLTNIGTLPSSGLFYIRARGIAPSSAGKSASVYEVVQAVNLSSAISTSAYAVAPVLSNTPWDEAHFVWTLDDSGILRITDTFSRSALVANETVLIGNTPITPTTTSGRLADLSTLGTVTTNTPLISGFAITGTTSRTVLVRAVGPSLVNFGVTDILAQPQLRLYDSTGAVIGSNNGWNNQAAVAAASAQTGAFPLSSTADAALVITLAPGTYTVHVLDGGAGSSGGNALVEIYDAGNTSDTSSHIANLSSRGTVSSRGSLVGGLVVAGDTAKTLLVRGIGPTLTRYGVGSVLGDPTISVYDGTGRLIATNDDWNVSSVAGVTNADYAAALTSANTSVGAFGLDAGSKDASLVIRLPAGAYSVQVTGVNGAAGAAMIEVYELP